MSPKSKRNSEQPENSPAEIKQTKTRNKRNFLPAVILVTIVVVLVAAVVLIAGYPTYAAMHKNIITVDNINIRMDYFIKRLQMSGADPIGLLSQITYDQMVKIGSERIGITVSDEEVDQTIRTMFEGSSANITSAALEQEYKEWYRQLLNTTTLKDGEYRDIVRVELLRAKLKDYLAAQMPTIVEHVHLYAITVETSPQADEVVRRWNSGESFTDIARELSIDTNTKDAGGEIGWFPEGGVLTSNMEYEAFSLTSGNISHPIPITDENQQASGEVSTNIIGYHIIWVSERAFRQLDDNALQVLKDGVVEKWLEEERDTFTIKWRGIKNNFDSETYAWLNYQLAKLKTNE